MGRRAPTRSGPAQAVMIARDNETRARAEPRRTRAAARLRAARRGALLRLGAARGRRPGDLPPQRPRLDVDNGMRGTVRHVDDDRVVIDTDAGLVRELPAAYVAEHVEHAYALTGHGMQGGTVEQAIVVASPHDLTAGWSYTALSRARGHTRLLDPRRPRPRAERGEFAPADRRADRQAAASCSRACSGGCSIATTKTSRSTSSPAPAAPTTAELAARSEQPRENRRRSSAAARAEPPSPAGEPGACGSCESTSSSCGHSSGRCRHASYSASRTSTHARSRSTTQREQMHRAPRRPATSPAGASDASTTPTRSSAPTWRALLKAADRELDAVLTQRERPRARAGRLRARSAPSATGCERAITQPTREHTEIRDELAEREAPSPGAWAARLRRAARRARGDAGMGEGVRQAARYRAQYDVTDPDDATRHPARAARAAARLGARPRGPRSQRAAPRPRRARRPRPRHRDWAVVDGLALQGD